MNGDCFEDIISLFDDCHSVVELKLNLALDMLKGECVTLADLEVQMKSFGRYIAFAPRTGRDNYLLYYRMLNAALEKEKSNLKISNCFVSP